MFDLQTMQTSSSPTFKANKTQQIKADNAYLNEANSNMPDHFRSSINRAADNRTSQALTNKIYTDCSDFLCIGCFEDMFGLQVKDDNWPYQDTTGG